MSHHAGMDLGGGTRLSQSNLNYCRISGLGIAVPNKLSHGNAAARITIGEAAWHEREREGERGRYMYVM